MLQEAVRISEEDLPLTLPETDNFKPSGNAESPLANITDWIHYTNPKTGWGFLEWLTVKSSARSVACCNEAFV